MAARVSGGRPVWAGHRRVADRAPRHRRCAAILCPGAAPRTTPVEVTTDRAAVYFRILDDFVPAALHVTEQYANDRVKADHVRLNARLRPTRGLKLPRSAAVIATDRPSSRTSAAATTNSPLTFPTAAPGRPVHRACPRDLNRGTSRPPPCPSRPNATEPPDRNMIRRLLIRSAGRRSVRRVRGRSRRGSGSGTQCGPPPAA